jgi:hypothetical protein
LVADALSPALTSLAHCEPTAPIPVLSTLPGTAQLFNNVVLRITDMVAAEAGAKARWRCRHQGASPRPPRWAGSPTPPNCPHSAPALHISSTAPTPAPSISTPTYYIQQWFVVSNVQWESIWRPQGGWAPLRSTPNPPPYPQTVTPTHTAARCGPARRPFTFLHVYMVHVDSLLCWNVAGATGGARAGSSKA